MPLEDLEGSNRYISDLQPDWPLGTEYLEGADNHLRGIKNVLRNTFPNVVGPVLLSDTELNRGSIPVGSRMVFHQASAPTGWVQVDLNPSTNNWMLVISKTSAGGAGGTTGGTNDPLQMTKVPSHTHKVQGMTTDNTVSHTHNGTTQGQSQNHTHYGTTEDSGSTHWHEGWTGPEDAGHSHSGVTDLAATYSKAEQAAQAANEVLVPDNTGDILLPQERATHAHTFQTGTQNLTHKHFVRTGGVSEDHKHQFRTGPPDATHNHAFTSGEESTTHKHGMDFESAPNTDAAAWAPHYATVILCQRQ